MHGFCLALSDSEVRKGFGSGKRNMTGSPSDFCSEALKLSLGCGSWLSYRLLLEKPAGLSCETLLLFLGKIWPCSELNNILYFFLTSKLHIFYGKTFL